MAEWADLLIGGRVLLRLPSGLGDGQTVALAGHLLGRASWRVEDAEFKARVRLDDGTVVHAELDSIVERID